MILSPNRSHFGGSCADAGRSARRARDAGGEPAQGVLLHRSLPRLSDCVDPAVEGEARHGLAAAAPAVADAGLKSGDQSVRCRIVGSSVTASEAKQSIATDNAAEDGLLRRYAPRNDDGITLFLAGQPESKDSQALRSGRLAASRRMRFIPVMVRDGASAPPHHEA